MRERHFIVAVGLLIATAGAGLGCERSGTSASSGALTAEGSEAVVPPDEALLGTPLEVAAMRMHGKRVRRGEIPTPGGELPREDWEPEVAALNPIRVTYAHGVNFAVAQRVEGGAEEGIYILNPISSLFPADGADGFTFSQGDDGLIHYRRAIEPCVSSSTE